MDNQKFKYQLAMESLLDDRKVWQQIAGHFQTELIPNKNNWFAFVLSLCVGVMLAVFIGTGDNTVALSREICSIFLDIQTVLFGIVLTVYSILLALLSDSYIKKLIRIGYHEQTNYLSESTRYYEAALYIFFVAMIISLCVRFVLICIPDYYLLVNTMWINECLASVLLSVYFTFSFRVVYELKSVIANTVLLFRSSLLFKINEFAESENKDSIDTQQSTSEAISKS